MFRIGQILIKLFVPYFCVGCGYPGDMLCAKCRLQAIRIVNQQHCHVCKLPISDAVFVHQECEIYTYLAGVLVATYYTALPRKIVRQIKYRFLSELVTVEAKIMAAQFQDLLSGATLVPIPASRRRRWWRGFNQSELLCKSLAHSAGANYAELLSRSRHVSSQVGKGKSDRLANLQGVFQVNKTVQKLPDKIILIDDVMTTGATLEQCAKVLLEAGASEVWGAVFARG